MNKPTLVVFHSPCADGFTAAWAAWKVFGDTAEYFPGVYQNPPPDCTDRDVFIVDFSYKRDVMVELSRFAKSLTILDHHKTAKEDLEGLEAHTHCPTVVQFDMERSGARMAWDYFHPGTMVPKLVTVVEDRDLWRFKDSDTRALMADIFSYEYTFENWDKLADELARPGTYSNHMAGGEAIERKHHKDIAELTRLCKFRMVIGGVEVWAASLPYTYTSDAGHLMAEEGEPFAACFWFTPEGVVFSLRSREGGADVSLVAKQYGGGGHKAAAGFRVPVEQFAKEFLGVGNASS